MKPIEQIEKTVVGAEEKAEKEIILVEKDIHKTRRHIFDFFHRAKEGTITGVADNDPAGVVTYTQVGARTGFSQLWIILLSLPMLTVVEEVSARIGVVTKKGINAVIRENFGLSWAVFTAVVLFLANLGTIAADIAGITAVGGILFKVDWRLFGALVVLILLLFLLKENYRKISRYMFLLTPFLLLYALSAIMAKPDWMAVAKDTFIPHLGKGEWWLLAVALLGTTISPYLIYWQASEEIESRKQPTTLKKEAKGVFFGMFYTHVIFFFIIVAAAATIFGKGIFVDSPQQAALALRPFVGDGAFLFFALAILFSGLLAVPVLASTTAYVIANTFGWPASLSSKTGRAPGFYIILIISLILGLLLSIFTISPIKLLVYSQVLQSLLMPPLVYFIWRISASKKIMGQYKNGFWSNFWLAITLIVIVLFDGILLINWIR